MWTIKSSLLMNLDSNERMFKMASGSFGGEFHFFIKFQSYFVLLPKF
jgi:hypothetical protein